MNTSANAITTKAKAMYGRRLKSEDYQALVKKKNISEIASYLKSETDYSSSLALVKENSIHRGELEELLKKEMFDRECRLIRYAGNAHRDFYRSGVIKGEIDVILSKIRLFNSSLYSEFASAIPYYLNPYTCFDLDELSKVADYTELCELLKKTPYAKVLNNYRPAENGFIDYVEIETALNKYFYDTIVSIIKSNFKGKTQKDCLTIFFTSIELLNISKIYRLKKYYHTKPEEIRKMLMLDYMRISKTMMNDLIEAADAESFMNMLSKSPYRIFRDSDDYVYIEYYAEQIKYHLSKRHMRFSSNAELVFMTYSILHNIEVNNLINIIEGVRYGVAPETIEKTCIY